MLSWNGTIAGTDLRTHWWLSSYLTGTQRLQYDGVWSATGNGGTMTATPRIEIDGTSGACPGSAPPFQLWKFWMW